MGFSVEIGASNTIRYEGEIDEIRKRLDLAQGTVSVVDLRTNTEVYFGTAQQVRDAIDWDLANI